MSGVDIYAPIVRPVVHDPLKDVVRQGFAKWDEVGHHKPGHNREGGCSLCEDYQTGTFEQTSEAEPFESGEA